MNELEKNIFPLNEMEEFYKKYHTAKQNNDTFSVFLANLDKETINAYYIPEVNDYKYDLFTEQLLFDNAKRSADNIAIYKHCRYTPPYMHTHTFFEIVYVWKGFCKNIIGGREIVMKKHDFCILASGARHALDVTGDDNIVMNIVVKKSTFAETFFKLLSIDSLISTFFTKLLYTEESMSYILFHPGDDEKFSIIMDYLLSEQFITDNTGSICRESLLISAFIMLLRHHSDTAEYLHPQSAGFSNISDIIRYIEENYKDVSLENVAKHFNYAVPYLSKIIKKSTGMTYTEITSELRYMKACSLLANTALPVYMISETVGYNNPEHFFKFFKKMSGMTPNQFRTGNH